MSTGSDLELLDVPVPRPAELAQRYARKLEPVAGFIAYGVLWILGLGDIAFVGGMMAGIGLGVAHIVSKDVGVAIGLGLGLVLFVLVVVSFAKWASRKRRRARVLIEHGVLTEGPVVDRASDKAAQLAARLAFAATGQRLATSWYRVELARDGHGYHVLAPFMLRPEPGATRRVLFHPDARYAFAFDASGRAIPCRLHDDGVRSPS
jgi:hypothetical protein